MPQIGSILCPVDFSEFSVNAYECARSLAWHYKATLILQHVLYPLYSGFARYDGNIDSYEEIARQLRAEGQEKLQKPEPVADKTLLDPKTYGVIVQAGRRRGLLLPDLEGVETADHQIEICRQKAGIAPDEPVNLHRFQVRRYK